MDVSFVFTTTSSLPTTEIMIFGNMVTVPVMLMVAGGFLAATAIIVSNGN